MGAALFYHVTQSSIVDVVVNLLTRAVQQGWQVELRGTSLPAMEQMDDQLWRAGGPAEFLPHGLAGGAHDALQPVLLTTTSGATSGRQAILSVDGADVRPEELDHHDRVWILFDGMDGAAVTHARGQWKGLTGAGAKAQYWSEESGRWEKKSES
ncbi:DNA polymerase III subunit chi [Thioclava sp. SK-1]|uniref:DNA polymerase III subunit chi n=1 Tax=Thioclava sp. SK-1 TaxID=1889770 RepID=UPI000824E2A4|nr:DNA polymerase III subunit chi [Thioclava sp. SK-1]OCX66136.1 DNA polymerase III subunit chi [Thioclava sp. SK-1]